MRFIALTKRFEPDGHITVDYDHIVAIQDNRFSTDVKDFAWTNIWMTNSIKFEVIETEKEILDMVWRSEQREY